MQLLRYFQPIVYVKLHPDMLTVREVGTDRELTGPPLAAVTRDQPRRVLEVGSAAKAAATSRPADIFNPFKHPRALLADFTLADQVIKGFVKKVLGKRLLPAKPIIVLHPKVDLEGGFTQIEIRTLRELGYGAGASKVFVWHGRELTDDELLHLRFEPGGLLRD